MDLRFPAAEEEFRSDVRHFVQHNWPLDMADRYHVADISICSWHLDDPEALDAVDAFSKKLARKGWWTMHWPRAYGGQEVSPIRRLVYLEEMSYQGAPSSHASGGELFMHYGTPWMKDHFIPKIAQADIGIALGLSEPAAGSDLASVQTRATRDGDYWVINGQKTWNSTGHRSQWIRLLARTNTSAPKHRGLSFFVVPLDAPGVTLRPLYDMMGRRRWSEIFFDNVRIPADHLLGEEDRGWYLVMGELNEDRSNVPTAAILLREFERVLDVLRRRRVNGEVLTSQPVPRNRLADVRVSIEALRMLCYRAGWQQTHLGEVDPRAASINQFLVRELYQRIFRVAADLIGPEAYVLPGSGGPSVFNGFLGANATLTTGLTIGHGTREIQKNIIAQRGLGLPR